MSTDTPTPERVTLTDEEQEDLREAIDADETWRDDCDECDNAISDDHHLFATVGAIIAAREQALREEIADLRSRLGCVNEATNWDRPYDTRLDAIRGMCDLDTDGMTAVAESDTTTADLRAQLAKVDKVRVHWETALGLNSCPSCAHVPETDCDHGEGYHHALSDLSAARIARGGAR